MTMRGNEFLTPWKERDRGSEDIPANPGSLLVGKRYGFNYWLSVRAPSFIEIEDCWGGLVRPYNCLSEKSTSAAANGAE